MNEHHLPPCSNDCTISCFQGAVIEDDEDENKEEEPPENRIEVEIPRIVTQLGSNPHYVKLPNFLSVETRSETKHQFDCYNLILTA